MSDVMNHSWCLSSLQVPADIHSLQPHPGHHTAGGGQQQEVEVSGERNRRRQSHVPGLHLCLPAPAERRWAEPAACRHGGVSGPAAALQPHRAVRRSAAHGGRSGRVHLETGPPESQDVSGLHHHRAPGGPLTGLIRFHLHLLKPLSEAGQDKMWHN